MIVIATFCTLDILIVFLFVIFGRILLRRIMSLPNTFFWQALPAFLNKDPAHWIDGAIPHKLVLMVVPLPESEFDGRHDAQQNNIQHNDTRHYDTQHNGPIYDTQHK
jgi:hypothetical protein